MYSPRVMATVRPHPSHADRVSVNRPIFVYADPIGSGLRDAAAFQQHVVRLPGVRGALRVAETESRSCSDLWQSRVS
jgi:hypothetical protein